MIDIAILGFGVVGGGVAEVITIVPALSHFLFKKKIYGEKPESQHKEVGKLAMTYRNFLEKCLNHKWITSIIAIVLLVGSFSDNRLMFSMILLKDPSCPLANRMELCISSSPSNVI